MPTRAVPLLVAWFVASTLVAGCGREGAGPLPPPPSGPPRWSMVREEHQPDGGLVAIKADAPCRVVLSIVGAEGQARQDADRQLAAGEQARLWWRAEVVRVPKGGTSVSVEDAEAGRTEAWAATVHYGWQDGLTANRMTIVGTRQGRGSVRGPRDAAPPVSPTVLPFDGEVELSAVAVVDGGAPEVALVSGERGARIQGQIDEAAGDRAHVLRLRLKVVRTP
jgi:hypothetical protein